MSVVEQTRPGASRPVSHVATRLATRLAFLVAGFGIASWAPLVPFAKTRLGVEDGTLGLLLLCIGIGSVASMAGTGPLSAKFGTKPVILVGGFFMALVLPFLAIATTPVTLAAALLIMGAALGSIDVAMNIHAVEVERVADKPLMSGFHGLFSIGGFAGSTLMTFLLSAQLSPLAATLASSAMMVVTLLIAWPRFLTGRQGGSDDPLFVVPRGIVLLLAILAFIGFLAEGAILDWSALLITEAKLVSASQGGLGYMLFAIAMTVGRLTGDRLVARIGDRATLLWGGIVTIAGFVVLLVSPIAVIAMAGFLLIGLGASNIVPVLFRKAGTQKVMPTALAVGAITTLGYAGILAGPAAIGFVSHLVGLHTAFWMLVALLCLVPLSARLVTASQDGKDLA